jgi:GT2 family glycosyltransferase
MISVSIVTVNFKEEALTIDFLRSIYKCERINLEVIVVDNGSVNNNEEIFRDIYPGLIYIQSEKNLGFAGGNNLGIQKASGKYVLLLNNDTEVTSNLIYSLVIEMEGNPEIGLISPLILYYEDKRLIQYAGFSKMNYLTGRNKTIGKFEMDNGQYDNLSRETGFCHGAAMMCRKLDLVEVGLMDENYFLYYEEMDWCEKFKRNGKKIWFTGKAKIYHKESVSVGKESNLKTYFLTRNRMLFIRKNTSFPVKLIFGFYFYGIACPVLALKYFINGKKNQIKWIGKAMLWHLKPSKDNQFIEIS